MPDLDDENLWADLPPEKRELARRAVRKMQEDMGRMAEQFMAQPLDLASDEFLEQIGAQMKLQIRRALEVRAIPKEWGWEEMLENDVEAEVVDHGGFAAVHVHMPDLIQHWIKDHPEVHYRPGQAPV